MPSLNNASYAASKLPPTGIFICKYLQHILAIRISIIYTISVASKGYLYHTYIEYPQHILSDTKNIFESKSRQKGDKGSTMKE